MNRHKKTVTTKPQDMSPEDIRIAMIKAGVTQSGIARKLGVKQPSIYKIIMGQLVSHKIRCAIAEATGIDLKKIWPSTYLNDGPKGRGRQRCLN